METFRRVKPSFLLVILFCIVKSSWCEFELCNPHQSTTVYKFKKDHCPFGVLFTHPIIAYCMQSTNQPEFFITDLCDPNNYTLNTDLRPFKVHLAFKMDEEAVEESTSCLGEGPEKCNVTDFTEASPAEMTEPGGTGCDPDEHDEELDISPEENNQTDIQVANQTERLFKFMLGLTVDPDETGPSGMKIIKLLKHSFRILNKYCDSKYVPVEFGEDILLAFLFLFREANKAGFMDTSDADFNSITKSLQECENLETPFTLIGQTCKSCANIHSIEKYGKSRRYIPDEFSFQWGKFDVPVDATWSVMNFVHGLCYGTYSPYVNYHHLYQREMERLFMPSIMRRWTQPTVLYHEDIWDHIFSATVKNAMKNLDVCIAAAYQDTPFLHRLERPRFNDSQNGTSEDAAAPPSTKRRKRSLPTMLLDEGGLEGAGWCFQSEEDMLSTVEAYVNVHCPENRKVVDEVKTSLKEEEPAETTEAPENGGGAEATADGDQTDDEKSDFDNVES